MHTHHEREVPNGRVFWCSLVLSEPYFLSILIQDGIQKNIVDQNFGGGGGVPAVPRSKSATVDTLLLQHQVIILLTYMEEEQQA